MRLAEALASLLEMHIVFDRNCDKTDTDASCERFSLAEKLIHPPPSNLIGSGTHLLYHKNHTAFGQVPADFQWTKGSVCQQ
jgi:hypothetical protein